MIIGITELPDSVKTLAAPIRYGISREVSRKSLFLRATPLPNVTCIYNFPGLFTFSNDQQTAGIYRCKRRGTDIPFCETPLNKIPLHEARPNSPPFLNHCPRTTLIASPISRPGSEACLSMGRYRRTAASAEATTEKRRDFASIRSDKAASFPEDVTRAEGFSSLTFPLSYDYFCPLARGST